MFGMQENNEEKQKSRDFSAFIHPYVVEVWFEKHATQLMALDAQALMLKIQEAILRGNKTFYWKSQVEEVYETFPKLHDMLPLEDVHKVESIIILDKVVNVTIHTDVIKLEK
jgi:uncharacterized protein (DUF952 family)